MPVGDYPDLQPHELSLLRKAFANADNVDWPLVLPPTTGGLPKGVQAAFVAGTVTRPTERATSMGRYIIRGLLRLDGEGVPVLSSVCVESFGPELDEAVVEVTGTVMRAVSVAAIRNRVLSLLGTHAVAFEAMEAVGGYGITPEQARRARDVAELAAQAPAKPGRPRKPPEDYERIARRYLELVKAGRRDVLKALAKEERRPRETIRDWVRKATKEGFLAPGKQGRAQVRPGPNLNPKEEDDGNRHP